MMEKEIAQSIDKISLRRPKRVSLGLEIEFKKLRVKCLDPAKDLDAHTTYITCIDPFEEDEGKKELFYVQSDRNEIDINPVLELVFTPSYSIDEMKTRIDAAKVFLKYVYEHGGELPENKVGLGLYCLINSKNLIKIVRPDNELLEKIKNEDIDEDISAHLTVGFYNPFFLATLYNTFSKNHPYIKSINKFFTSELFSQKSCGSFKNSIEKAILDKDVQLALFFVCEFIAYYISQSLIVPKIASDRGNKTRMKLLSRTSIRSWLRGFLLEISDEGTREKLERFILERFTHDTPRPFSPLAPNGVYIVQDKLFSKRLEHSYNKEVALPISIHSIIFENTEKLNHVRKKLHESFLEEKNNILKESEDVILSETLTNEQSIERDMQNLYEYDFFSPCPFSTNDDSLGQYSRKPYREVNKFREIPTFLFEIRYLGHVIESRKFNAFSKSIATFCKGLFDSFRT